MICDLHANLPRITKGQRQSTKERRSSLRHDILPSSTEFSQRLNNKHGLLKHSFVTRSRHLFTYFFLSRSFRTTTSITLVDVFIPTKTTHPLPSTRSRIRHYSRQLRPRCCRKFWETTIMPNWQRESGRGSEVSRMPNVKLRTLLLRAKGWCT